MIGKLIHWAVDQPLVVLLLAVALAAAGGYAFVHINVEAYPDPAPPLVEVVAQYPGASAEEIERRVTVPLEKALAGTPGLSSLRSLSLYGLSDIRSQFDYGVDYWAARQEVINRLPSVQNLPPGVNPQISPESPTGEIYRYSLSSPKDAAGRDVYTLNDLKALQDWTLEREFKSVKRIEDVNSFGGTVKRYEIHPNPDLLKRYGITLVQLQNAVANCNANVGGDYLFQGPVVENVRSIGLIGGGLDPMQAKRLFEAKDFRAAADFLRAEENRRLREIRNVVVASVNNSPVKVDDLVDGGPLKDAEELGGAPGTPGRGVVVGHQTRLGQVGVCRPKRDGAPGTPGQGREVKDAQGKVEWLDEDDKVQSIVLLRQARAVAARAARRRREGQGAERESRPALARRQDRALLRPHGTDRRHHGNRPREPDRGDRDGRRSILLMFLSNVRTALIVAINIPLALLFAFAMLYAAGQVGEPAVDRRGRFRHHRRFLGDHGREHLPPSVRRKRPICR